MPEAAAPSAAPSGPSAASPSSGAPRKPGRKAIKWIIAAIVLIVLAVFGWRYWRDSQLYASTDNAYVGADTVDVAAQVSGPVTHVFVSENQVVKAGDPLFDIDPAPFEIARQKATAQLALAGQSVDQQGAAISAAEAQVAQRQAELKNAQATLARDRALQAKGFLSRQGAETGETLVATATATLRAAQANVEQARSARGKTGEENAAVQAARAAADQAELDLKHTHVVAATDGSVANLSLRPGNVVQAGSPLFALISSKTFWVDANFKETELDRVRTGEQASIEVDMYPDHPFRGVVESLSGGSGTAFSLLPAQNATGNWVKVTQRVPVRIRILETDPQRPLRIGTTASVKIRLAS